jgi:hypothetical protein
VEEEGKERGREKRRGLMRKEGREDLGTLVSGSQGIYRKIRLTSTVATHPFARTVDICRWRGEGKISRVGL